MSVNKYLEGLAKPFDAECVKWRIQVTNNEKTSGLAVAYLDSRTIAKRLDEVVGQMRWKDEYKPWITAKNNASQICTISIYDDSLKEWISKSDGAELSNYSPIKGGLSDAFKRAAVKWGIGRYLYEIKPVWVNVYMRGDKIYIQDDEMPRLEQIYINLLNKINSLGKAPVQKNPGLQQSQTPKSATEQKKAQAPKQSGSTPLYEILGVKRQKDGQNVRSMLKIKDIKDGNKTATVYYNGTDDNFKEGAKLNNAVFYLRDTGFGKIHVLQDYELAA